MMRKTGLYWFLAVLLTLAAGYYQRVTGPTYDKKSTVTLGTVKYDFRLPRAHGGESNAPVEIEDPTGKLSGTIWYKRYPTGEDFQNIPMERRGESLYGELPHQPPAGKLAYYLVLKTTGETMQVHRHDPVIIRFRGDVPAIILIPHVLLMFLAMLLSNLAGMLAVVKHPRQRIIGRWALGVLLIGGFVFGPLMQYQAFGEAWTGIPLGWDLTDNKTLVAALFWILAVMQNRNKQRFGYTILAAVMLLLVYSIPHSVLGSEFDYESGEVVTGFIVQRIL